MTSIVEMTPVQKRKDYYMTWLLNRPILVAIIGKSNCNKFMGNIALNHVNSLYMRVIIDEYVDVIQYVVA